MSIIERYSPLNLAYQVVVVTNAMSPLGIVVCNTLLKSNALVLATDDKPKEESFSEGAYTHFQFHRCDIAAPESADAIIADAKKKFKVERVNALVNLVSADDDAKRQEGHRKLAEACAKVMKANDGGSIVNTYLQAVGGDAEGSAKTVENLIKTSKDTSASIASKKVRSNTVAPSADKENIKSCEQYDEAKKHMDFLTKPSHNPNIKADKPSPELVKMFEFSNLSLFLVSGMSEGLDGAVLTPDGNRVQG